MATRTRRLARVAAVIAIAAAAGHFMQADERGAATERLADAPPAPAPAPAEALPAVPPVAVAVAAPALRPMPRPAEPSAPAALAPAAPAPAAPAPASAVDVTRASVLDLTGTPPSAAPTEPLFGGVAPSVTEPAVPATPVTAAEAPVAAPCMTALDVIATPGAMLTLVLTAPCRADARVVLRHAGLAVSAQTSAAGTLTAALPAFDPAGAVTAQFDDGTRIEAAAPVADLGGLTRFAVQWVGADAFQLHAFRDAVDHGSAGHVHAGAPGMRGGPAGHLTVLGSGDDDRALRAEVYTFPADPSAVRLDLEAAVTPATCGRDLLGETVQWAAGALVRRDLTLPMPACDEGAGYLVLQNPLYDLTLAAR